MRSQVFDETPLGKRREALAEANGWYEGNPSFGRVSPDMLRVCLKTRVCLFNHRPTLLRLLIACCLSSRLLSSTRSPRKARVWPRARFRSPRLSLRPSRLPPPPARSKQPFARVRLCVGVAGRCCPCLTALGPVRAAQQRTLCELEDPSLRCSAIKSTSKGCSRVRRAVSWSSFFYAFAMDFDVRSLEEQHFDHRSISDFLDS